MTTAEREELSRLRRENRVQRDERAWPSHSVADGGHVPKFVHHILASMAEAESRQIGERSWPSRAP